MEEVCLCLSACVFKSVLTATKYDILVQDKNRSVYDINEHVSKKVPQLQVSVTVLKLSKP